MVIVSAYSMNAILVTSKVNMKNRMVSSARGRWGLKETCLSFLFGTSIIDTYWFMDWKLNVKVDWRNRITEPLAWPTNRIDESTAAADRSRPDRADGEARHRHRRHARRAHRDHQVAHVRRRPGRRRSLPAPLARHGSLPGILYRQAKKNKKFKLL